MQKKLLGWSIFAGIGLLLIGLFATGSTPPYSTPAVVQTQPRVTREPQPQDQLTIADTTWEKGAFGTVALMRVTIRNAGKRAVRDVNLNCYFYGASGSTISHTNVTVYVVVPAGKSKKSDELNLGFINSQVTSAGCTVITADWA